MTQAGVDTFRHGGPQAIEHGCGLFDARQGDVGVAVGTAEDDWGIRQAAGVGARCAGGADEATAEAAAEAHDAVAGGVARGEFGGKARTLGEADQDDVRRRDACIPGLPWERLIG